MHRHDRGLGDAENEERQQQAHGDRRQLAGKDAAGVEIERPGGDAGPGDRRQQEQRRGAKQHQEIQSPGRPRLFGATVGDQRIGHQRQHFVEQKEREQVAGERDAHGGGDGEREADVEDGLARFPVRSHVADRIERIDDPQAGGDHREEHAERLDREGDRQAGQDVEQVKGRPLAGEHLGEQHHDEGEEDQRAEHRGAFARVRPTLEQRHQDGRRRRHGKGKGDEFGAAHPPPPISAAAALAAMPAVRSASSPKNMVAPASSQIGISISSGASVALAAVSVGSRNQTASTTRPT